MAKKHQYSLAHIKDIKNLDELAPYYKDLLKYAKGKFSSSNYEDILQETFLKLDRAFKRGSVIQGGYIGLTMYSVDLDLKREYAKYNYGTSTQESVIPDLEDNREDIEQKLQLEKNYSKMEAALNNLDFYDSKIIEFTNEMTYVELSKQTGIPKVSLSIRRKKIIEHLKQECLRLE